MNIARTWSQSSNGSKPRSAIAITRYEFCRAKIHTLSGGRDYQTKLCKVLTDLIYVLSEAAGVGSVKKDFD